MPDFSVVICAYTLERWDDLLAALAAVDCQTLPPREVIVVIDHNRELWQALRAERPDVIAIENTEARGLSGARNSGLRVAQAEVVAFLDEDAIPAADWLEQLSRGYGDPLVLGVGGAIEPLWAAGRPGWFPEEFDWVVGCTYRGMPRTPAPVRNLIGCNMSFRRDLFARIGGFRNGIGRVGAHPAGCEETELCIRARRHFPQGNFLYRPQARVAHRVPAKRATWRYFWSRCYFEGRSKAVVAALAGSRAGLASERAYALNTLPRGMARNVRASVRPGARAGLARAAAILAGCAITALGYGLGRCLAPGQGGARPAPLVAPAAEQKGPAAADVRSH
jgi:GT2 family glycosyltransferase